MTDHAHLIVGMQTSSDSGNSWLIYALFLVAGLFVGGAWAAHQNDNKPLTIGAAVIAVLAFVGGVLWMIGEMT